MAKDQEMIERLVRIETLLENGIRKEIGEARKWIKNHPEHCPYLTNRKNRWIVLATQVGVLTVLIKAADMLFRMLGWL